MTANSDTNPSATPKAAPVKPAAKPITKEPKPNKKLPLLITLLVVGVLLLAGLGFAIWWFAYYNSDNKVLRDAFYSTLDTTEGTGEMKMSAKISGDASTPDMNLEFNIRTNYNRDIASFDIDGKFSASIISVSASANVIANRDGDVYVRINDLNSILNNLGLDSTVLGGFDANKLSDKWIKIGPDDLKNLVPTSALDTNDYAQCNDRVTALVKQRDIQKEIFNAITDSKILTAKRVGSDRDGIKFRLTGDLANGSEFIKTLADTEIYRAISDCFKTSIDSNTEIPMMTDTDWDEALSQVDELRDQLSVEVYFWVGAWDHQPTRLSVNIRTSNPDVEFTLDATRKNGKVNITTPSDSTSLTTILQSLQGINLPQIQAI
jgi:hypothetical protein